MSKDQIAFWKRTRKKYEKVTSQQQLEETE